MYYTAYKTTNKTQIIESTYDPYVDSQHKKDWHSVNSC